MRKAVSSFTTQKRESRCLLSYLSIRHQFVNPQWAVCSRIWKNKILGVPSLPDDYEFAVVFRYRLVTELHCVHKVQSLSRLWSLLKTEFKWIQTLINNIWPKAKPNHLFISQQSDLGWVLSYVGWATCAKKKKWLRNSWYLLKICVFQSGSLLGYTSLMHVQAHSERQTSSGCNTTKLHGEKSFVQEVFRLCYFKNIQHVEGVNYVGASATGSIV